MLESFIKACRDHEVHDPIRMLQYIEQAARDKVAESELPGEARPTALDALMRSSLTQALALPVCKSELGGTTTFAVYAAAALFNELRAAQAALTEANAALIANNLDPVEASNDNT